MTNAEYNEKLLNNIRESTERLAKLDTKGSTYCSEISYAHDAAIEEICIVFRFIHEFMVKKG